MLVIQKNGQSALLGMSTIDSPVGLRVSFGLGASAGTGDSMKVDFAFLCDYAEATNKINALGIGFDTIYATAMPTKHRHFSIVVKLRATLMEAGDKNIEVRLIDEDGNDVLPPAQGQLNIPKPEGRIESTGRFLMEFGGVEFKRYGTHSVRVAIEGVEMVAIPFAISPPPSRSK